MDWLCFFFLSSFLYAQLGLRRGEVLEYNGLRRTTICARFLRPVST